MTKLQTIEAEFQTLSAEEQREFISRYIHLTDQSEDDIFELTVAELAELDDRMRNDTETLTMEEVFAPLREKYESHNLA